MNSENIRKLREADEDQVRQMQAWLEKNRNELLCIRLAVDTRIEAVKDRIKWMDELGTG